MTKTTSQPTSRAEAAADQVWLFLAGALVLMLIAGWGLVSIFDEPDLDLETLPALGNGTHTVGSQDAPHATWIAPGGERCRWAAYAGIGDGQPMAVGQGAGRQVVNLDDGAELLRTEQCGTWTLASLTPAQR